MANKIDNTIDINILSDLEKLSSATTETFDTIYDSLKEETKTFLQYVSNLNVGDPNNKIKIIAISKTAWKYLKTIIGTAVFGRDIDGTWGKYSFTYKDSDGNDILTTSNAFVNLFKLTKGTSLVNSTIGVMNFGSSVLNYAAEEKSFSEMRDDWISYGNGVLNSIKSPWKNNGTINDLSSFIENGVAPALSSIGGIVAAAVNGIGLAVSQTATVLINDELDAGLKAIEDRLVDAYSSKGVNVAEQIADALYTYQDQLGGDSVILSVVGKGLQVFSNALMNYENGVSETSFGRMMESSWSRNGSASFLSRINQNFVFSNTTPLDAGDDNSNIYGKMILGTPPLFTHITDPQNRTISSKYLSDSRYLTLFPGFPQYNGSNILLSKNDDQYHQTPDPQSMIDYLKKHGFDSTMYSKDRRYYTFKSDYDEYFKYLETLLNAIWVKMGLGDTNNGDMNLYTFFNMDSVNGAQNDLKSQYRQGIGFFVSQPQLAEGISNNSTTYGSTYQQNINTASETYNQINYLSGMGTGGAIRNTMAITARAGGLIQNTAATLSNLIANTRYAQKSTTGLSKIFAVASGMVKDAIRFSTEEDLGAILQSYAVTNGMKVVYPELWADSLYSKSMSFDVEFISPYGDPLSIFKYVMVPFATLITFALPRQAADNGYVSPFFIRADIPGLLSCDFGLITDFNWTRGGSQQLWTKDGLPRAISCNFSIQDLYPYLAMTKRLSFLSANPNYTSWLDSLSGVHATNVTNSNNALNEYWKKLLNHISGNGNSDIYNINEFSTQSKNANNLFANSNLTNKLRTNSLNIPWLRK